MSFVNSLLVVLLLAAIGQFNCQDEDDVDAPNYPDLSCREGFTGGDQEDELTSENQNCRYGATPGPNTPEADYDSSFGVCVKFCVLHNLILIEADDQTRKFTVVKEAWTDGLFNETIRLKVHAQCSDLFETVFNVEKELCNSIRANDVYDCFQNALC